MLGPFIFSVIFTCFFSFNSYGETKTSFYSDGEVKLILERKNKRPYSKILFKKINPTNEMLREKITYKYKSGWKCELIEKYRIKPNVPVHKRSHLLNIKMISKSYCNKKGEVVLKDYYRENKYNEMMIFKREVYKKRKLTQSFEILFKKYRVIGFKEFLYGKTYKYFSGNESILSSTTYLNPEEIKVMVIDSGLDFSHSQFFQKVVVNNKEIPNNGIDDDRNGFVDDFYGLDLEENDGHAQEIIQNIDDFKGPIKEDKLTQQKLFPGFHGTHVAGIVIDHSSSAKVFPVRGDYLTYKFWDRIDKYLSVNQFDFINMSAGILIRTRDPEFPRFKGLEGVIDRHKETLFIFPSGNDGLDVDNLDYNLKVVPARYRSKNTLIVAAINNNSKKRLTKFSNYGVFSVDVAAPGKDINAARPGNTFIKHSGTSMASPMVAGVASDIKSILLESTWGEHYRFSSEMTMLIKKIIMASVDINFKNPLPVRSGGVVNPKLAKELAFTLSAKDSLPSNQDVYDTLKFIISETEYLKRIKIWEKRGGIF